MRLRLGLLTLQRLFIACNLGQQSAKLSRLLGGYSTMFLKGDSLIRHGHFLLFERISTS